MLLRACLAFLLFALWPAHARAQGARRVAVAVLELGATPASARAAERLAKLLAASGAGGATTATTATTKAPLKASAAPAMTTAATAMTAKASESETAMTTIAVLDRGMSAAAARGVGYAGSLNMTLAEARALGAALGCDFYLTGDAQTIRRSSSARPVYFESYASVFVVSARTGRLVLWDRPAAEADDARDAEAALLALLDARAPAYAAAVAEAAGRDERERFDARGDAPSSVIDLSTGDGADANADLREPAPYRRLRPAYTDAAARAEAEATVDAEVEIGADGRVGVARVVRWAGFGLDEEVVSTVRRMRFRPASRDGEPVAVRVLLRYNFRKPAQAGSTPAPK
ncbi:MAG TPA: TonB family protein [Pyrinomonadaceae bacterium]|jgi:TonB family protein